MNNTIQKNKKRPSFTSMYAMPALIILGVIGAAILFKLSWWYLIIVAGLLFCRWVYLLPESKKKKEFAVAEQEHNKEQFIKKIHAQWDKEDEQKQQKLSSLKKEWAEKRKLLNDNKHFYPSRQTYWAKYTELGLDALEKELQVGYHASKKQSKKSGGLLTGITTMLYDQFLSRKGAAIERKYGFDSTKGTGYKGESTGGQSADDFGGGSSGGGGATN